MCSTPHTLAMPCYLYLVLWLVVEPAAREQQLASTLWQRWLLLWGAMSGGGEEELHHTLQGWDVTGLFPAMESKNTGIICRNEILESTIKIEGFQWKQGATLV